MRRTSRQFVAPDLETNRFANSAFARISSSIRSIPAPWQAHNDLQEFPHVGPYGGSAAAFYSGEQFFNRLKLWFWNSGLRRHRSLPVLLLQATVRYPNQTSVNGLSPAPCRRHRLHVYAAGKAGIETSHRARMISMPLKLSRPFSFENRRVSARHLS